MAVVRDARPEDAERIAEVHVDSWRETYRGHFPDTFLETLSVAQRTRFWQQRLAHPAPRESVLVVDAEGRVWGFAYLGPARQLGSTEGELYAIYLDPVAYRRGWGRMLMGAAEARLSELGFRTARLWVLEGNDRARRFYEAMGWELEEGLRIEQIGGVDANEVMYRRDVASTSGSMLRRRRSARIERTRKEQ